MYRMCSRHLCCQLIRGVLHAAQLVNLVALLAAWIVVFDTIAKEREMLEMTEQDVYNTMESGQAAPGVPPLPFARHIWFALANALHIWKI